MTQDLFKIFEKYRLGERAMLCLWVNGQLNTAIREKWLQQGLVLPSHDEMSKVRRRDSYFTMTDRIVLNVGMK